MKKQRRNPSSTTTRLSDREIERDLKAIYAMDGGKMPDLQRLEQRNSHPIRNAFLVLIGLGIVGLIAAWIGFFVFHAWRPAVAQAVSLAIEGPSQVTIGKEMVYHVNWKNQNATDVTGSIRLTFPSDFVRTMSDPANDSSEYPMTLPAGQVGVITVRGRFTGNIHGQSSIQAIGTFTTTNARHDSVDALATEELSYADSVIRGTLLAPPKSLPGDVVRIGYRVENTGDQPLDQATVQIPLPAGFTLQKTTSTSVTVEDGQAKIPLPTIASGASSTVFVSGNFSASTNGVIPLHADVGTRVGASRFVMASTDATIEVLSGDLRLDLIVNGGGSPISVDRGQALHVTLGYENTSGDPIAHTSFRVIALPDASSTRPSAPKVIDWAKIQLSASGTRAGDRVEWPEKKNPAFTTVPVRANGSLEFDVPLLSSSTDPASSFQLIGEATYTGIGGQTITRTLRTDPVVIYFRSGFKFTADARYTSDEGVQLGSGPLPPVVGSSTTYRLMWRVEKQSHELRDLRCTATLAPNVLWKGNETVGAGTFAWDESSRTITWTIKRLPESVQDLEADVAMELTPKASDKGKFAALTSNAECTGTDIVTNEKISAQSAAITTDLPNDPQAKRKGVVRSE